MAEPDRDVVCMVGDGSYMMLNSELATAAMMGVAFTVVVTDNRGYGCINRLQMATGGAEFNNLLKDAHGGAEQPRSTSPPTPPRWAPQAVKVGSIAELEPALARRHEAAGPYVVVIDTDPYPSTPHGGTWWDVAVPEVSSARRSAPSAPPTRRLRSRSAPEPDGGPGQGPPAQGGLMDRSSTSTTRSSARSGGAC